MHNYEQQSDLPEQEPTSRRFSKKRNKFHTIESAETVVPTHFVFSRRLKELYQVTVFLKQILLILSRLERIASADFEWAFDVSLVEAIEKIFRVNIKRLEKYSRSSTSHRHYHAIMSRVCTIKGRIYIKL